MKVGIVTVYNTPNCGSFLQAYALQKVLQQKGHEVYFIKNVMSQKRRWYYRFPQTVKYILKGDFVTAQDLTQPYSIFRPLQQNFSITSKKNDLDLIICGSDTIWNIADGYFLKHWKRFFGQGVKTKKISYAASAGSTALDTFEKNPEIKACLSEFTGLGVRDIPTGEIVSALLPDRDDIVQVLDPTMLLNCEDYEEISANCPERDFILVYYFGELPEALIQKIQTFAKEKNKKIIAFGNRSWADLELPYDPRFMLSYYKNADFIITNTFHGNIFSILFHKQFVSFGKEKRKVEALLSEFDLSNRLVEKAEEIEKVFMQEIDGNAIEQKLKEKREVSYSYLEKYLDK